MRHLEREGAVCRRISPRRRVFAGILLLLVLLTACARQESPRVTPSHRGPFVEITSQRSSSHFAPGMSNVDTSLFYPWGNNAQMAVERAKELVKEGLSFINQPIMGWGSDDPWPDPDQAEPNNWNTLDNKMQIALDAGVTPVITLCEAPWWMKGQLQPDGSTKLLTKDDEFQPISTSSRILDNKMDDWLKLVRRVAERYMIKPYNVRYFQVWNELKGYYNPATNNWDMNTSPGDPGEPHAKHGYTYMYNKVYDTLKQVAIAQGIDPATVQVGGPYVVMHTWSGTWTLSSPSRFTKTYGNYDQRDLDAVKYWLQHKAGGEFITIDGGNGNQDGIDRSDPFTAAEKFADVVRWIRSLDRRQYPGGATLPIWWAEWYADTTPGFPSSEEAVTAIKTYAMIKLIKAGGAAAFQWGALGEGEKDNRRGLWTPTDTADGGYPSRWYYAYQWLKSYFPPGTIILGTRSSPEVDALVNVYKTILVNKTAQVINVDFQGKRTKLQPYQVELTDTPSLEEPGNTGIPDVILLVLIMVSIAFWIRRPVSRFFWKRSASHKAAVQLDSKRLP